MQDHRHSGESWPLAGRNVHPDGQRVARSPSAPPFVLADIPPRAGETLARRNGVASRATTRATCAGDHEGSPLRDCGRNAAVGTAVRRNMGIRMVWLAGRPRGIAPTCAGGMPRLARRCGGIWVFRWFGWQGDHKGSPLRVRAECRGWHGGAAEYGFSDGLVGRATTRDRPYVCGRPRGIAPTVMGRGRRRRRFCPLGGSPRTSRSRRTRCR